MALEQGGSLVWCIARGGAAHPRVWRGVHRTLSIETIFQESGAYPGLETRRGGTENTVLSAAPYLFGLFSVIALSYSQLPARCVDRVGLSWPANTEQTFSDTVTAVRRRLWSDWVSATPA